MLNHVFFVKGTNFFIDLFQVSLEALRVARVVVTKFIFDEIEAAENLEESSTLGEAWERENYLKYQILSFKVPLTNCEEFENISL